MLNIHLFLSPIKNESRLEKEVSSLLSRNIVDKILVFGYWEEGLEEVECRSEKLEIHRTKLPSDTTKRTGLLKKVYAYISLFTFLNRFIKFCKINKPDIISVHNPVLLPVAYFVVKRTKAKLIYVPHELEVERTGLKGILKKVTIWIEKKYIYKCDGLTVVCEPIKEWYENNYKIEGVGVVPNIPVNPFYNQSFQKKNLFREEFQIPQDEIIFIYQGVLSEARGIDDLITVFRSVNKNKHLVLMGYGEMEDELIEIANDEPNIHFKSAVPPKDIIKYSSSADVGLFFNTKEMTLSYQYSMPNKFFEYAVGRLLIVVSDNFIEQSRLIKKENLGLTVKPALKELEKTVNDLTKEIIEEKVQASEDYRKLVSWKNNEEVIEDVYKGKLKLKRIG